MLILMSAVQTCSHVIKWNGSSMILYHKSYFCKTILKPCQNSKFQTNYDTLSYGKKSKLLMFKPENIVFFKSCEVCINLFWREIPSTWRFKTFLLSKEKLLKPQK